MALEQTGLQFIAKDLGSFLSGLQSAARGVGQFVQSAEKSAGSLNILSGHLKNFGQDLAYVFRHILLDAIRGLGDALHDIVGKGLEQVALYDRMEGSLKALTAKELLSAGSVKTFADGMKAATPIVQENLRWIEKLALVSTFESDEIASVQQYAQSVGIATKEAKLMTFALTAWGTVTKKQPHELLQVSNALTDMFTKGRVQSEEMRQLTRNNIPAWEYLAKAMGVTTDKAREMVHDGLVPANIGIKAIVEGIAKDYGPAMKDFTFSIAGITSSFQDIAKIGLRELFKPAVDAVLPSLTRMVAILTQDDVRAKIQGWGIELGQVAAKAMNFAEAMVASGHPFEFLALKVDEALPGFFSFVQQLEHLAATIQKIVAQAFGWGEDIGKNIAKGLLSAASHVVDALQHIADTILHFMKGGKGEKGAPNVAGGFEKAPAFPGGNPFPPEGGPQLPEGTLGLDESILSPINEALDQLNEEAAKAREHFAGLREEFEKAKEKASEVSAVLGPLGPVVAGVGGAFGTVFATGVATAAFNLVKLLSPIGLLSVGIGLLYEAWVTDFGGIQEITEAAVGSLAETASNLALTLEPVWQSLERGAGILPTVITLFYQIFPPEVAEALTETLLTVRDRFDELLGIFEAAPTPVQGFLDVISNISPVMGAAIGVAEQTLPALKFVVQNVFDDIVAYLKSNGGQIVSEAQTTWTSVQTTIQSLVTPIANVVNAVLEQILIFWNANGQEIMSTTQQIWSEINQIIQGAMQLIQATVGPALTAIAGFIRAHSSEIQAILTDAWNVIKSVIDIALTAIKGVIKAALAAVKGDWAGAWQAIDDACARIVTDMLQIIVSGLDSIKNEFQMAVDAIKGIWQALIGDAAGIGSDIVSGILSGIQSAAGGLISYMQGLAQQALDAAKSVIHAQSPSKRFADEVGAPAVQGIIMGMEDTEDQLIGTTQQLLGGMIKQFENVGDTVRQLIQGAFSQFSKSSEDVKDMSDKTGEMSQAFDDGSSFAGDFEDSLQSMAPWVDDLTNRFQELGSAIDELDIPEGFQMHSPSEFEQSLTGIAQAMDILLAAINKAPAALQGLSGVTGELYEDFLKAQEAAKKLMDQLKEQALESAVGGFKQMRDNLEMQLDAYDALTSAKKAAEKAQEAYNKSLQQGDSTVTGAAFVDLQIANEKVQALKDIQKRVDQDLEQARKEYLQKAATDPENAQKLFDLRSKQIKDLANIDTRIQMEQDADRRAMLMRERDFLLQQQKYEMQLFQQQAQQRTDELEKQLEKIADAFAKVFLDAPGVAQIEGFGQVLQEFYNIIVALSNAQLPDWLQPGSPTPLEYALIGISKQMKELSTYTIPAFQAQMQMTMMPATFGQMAGRASSQSYTYAPQYNLGVTTNQSPNMVYQSYEIMRDLYG